MPSRFLLVALSLIVLGAGCANNPPVEEGSGATKQAITPTQQTAPAASAPSNWKSYTSEKMGVTFGYPNTWSLQPVPSTNATVSVMVSPPIVGDPGPVTVGSFLSQGFPSVSAFAKEMGYQDLLPAKNIATLLDGIHKKDALVTLPGTTTVNGVTVHQVVVGGMGATYELIRERSNGEIITISFPGASRLEELTPEAKKVLDGFSF